LGCTFLWDPWHYFPPQGMFACLFAGRFRWTTTRTTSLALVLCAVHGHRFLFPGTGQQGISGFYNPNKRPFNPGYAAADSNDFLASPSSLHKCIQENVDAARRRCLIRTDLTLEHFAASHAQADSVKHPLTSWTFRSIPNSVNRKEFDLPSRIIGHLPPGLRLSSFRFYQADKTHLSTG
jgi:hypothetical protein